MTVNVCGMIAAMFIRNRLALPLIVASFIHIVLIILLSGCNAPAEQTALAAEEKITLSTVKRIPHGSVTYDVTESMTVVNAGSGQPSKQNLWVALIGDVPPYQRVESLRISPSNYQIIDDEYGNRYAEFDLIDMPPGSSVEIEVKVRVTANDLIYDLETCEGAVPDLLTESELHVESNNPQIVALAKQLAADIQDPCRQVRAFYNYAGDELVYTFNGHDWGAQAALGDMGADCTEYSSLVMALSRARGYPARYLEGLSFLANGEQGLARTEHSWLEVYLPGVGWTAMDPTLGRSPLTRENYFAKMPPNHIIVTKGRNPSVLRGASYWTHLYWPGNSTEIRVDDFGWDIRPVVGD